MKSNHSIKGIIAAVILHGFLLMCLMTFSAGAKEKAAGVVRILLSEEKEEAHEAAPEEAPSVEAVEAEPEIAAPREPELDFKEPPRKVDAALESQNPEKPGPAVDETPLEAVAAPGDFQEEREIETTESHDAYAAVEMVEGGTTPSVCGNGKLERGEECDDGNHEKYDGCSPGCRLEDDDETYRELYVEYGTLLRGYISKFTRYPERARMKRLEGVVIVTFEIYRDGKVKNIQVEQSSGFSILDKEAKEAVRYPERLPAPTDNLLRFGEPIIGRMHFNFTLKGVSFEE